MSDIASLERMLRSDAALEQARLAQSGAINTQQLLKQPLSNFNPGSLRNPANIPSLERLQASIRVQQYMQSGTISHMPAFVPRSQTPAGGTGGAGVSASTPLSAANSLGGTQTLTRSINLPHQIQLPTTAQLTRQARTIGASAARRLGPAILAGGVELGASYLQLANDGLNDTLRNQLPSNMRPVWDNLAGPNGLLERWLTPPNVAGVRESLRQVQDLDRVRNGLPPRSLLGLIAEPLTCQIFGVGCPETSPEGIPNLGSPGGVPPFYGGQSAVMYHVVTQTNSVDNNGYEQIGLPDPRTVLGPIRGIAKFPVDTPEGHRTEVRLLHAPMADRPDGQTYIGSYLTSAFQSISPRIISISRVDGQPDTGGNPQPEPDADNRPATVPALPNRQIFPPPNAPGQPDLSVPYPPTITPPATPTAPPGTTTPDAPPPDSDEDSPLNPFNPNSPFIPAFMPTRPPTGQRGFNPSGSPQGGAALDGPRVGTGTQPPNPVCRYDNSNIAGRVDQTNVTLNAVQLFMQNEMMGKLNTIDAKLGPQLPNGGVSGFLGKMFDFAKKTWNFLQVDRVLSVLTWIGVLHNAYMLSNGISQTLFSAISNILDVFGIEDADGNALDIGSIVSEWTDNFFKSIFGVETVDGIKDAWKKFNRIYQAAANIVFSIQSITFSMVEIMETISNYVGRIGNALRKSGEVLENAYNWMNPNANYTNNRFFNALNNTQEAVEALDSVASEVLSIQETGAELFNQKQEFDTALGEAESLIKTSELTGKNNSVRPDVAITPEHETRAEDE